MNDQICECSLSDETCPNCLKIQKAELRMRVEELEKALREIHENSLKCETCSASFLAEKALGGGE
jgi:hypothetical protein